MLRRLYDWTMSLASGPRAPYALGAVSFAESSFFPIPPDILLIPMVIARRAKAFSYALLCTITSVLGGAAGYAIGALLFVQLAEPILSFYGYLDKFETFRSNFNDYGAWIVFIAGVAGRLGVGIKDLLTPTIARQVIAPAIHGRVIGLGSMTWSIGFMVGSLAAGPLIDEHPGMLFWLVAIAAAAALPVIGRLRTGARSAANL